MVTTGQISERDELSAETTIPLSSNAWRAHGPETILDILGEPSLSNRSREEFIPEPQRTAASQSKQC